MCIQVATPSPSPLYMPGCKYHMAQYGTAALDRFVRCLRKFHKLKKSKSKFTEKRQIKWQFEWGMELLIGHLLIQQEVTNDGRENEEHKEIYGTSRDSGT